MRYKIIVVDNSNQDIRTYNMMPVFAECGFEIAGHTADLTVAVDQAASKNCDVLLCVNRPAAVIAADLLKRAAKAKLHTPIIIISKVNASNDMRECFLLGAVDYLTEPVLEDDIRAALLRVIKQIGRNITSAEFEKALKKALELIPPEPRNGAFTEKLRDLLEKTGGGALTVEEAADHFGFNPDYFGRYFKSRVGMPFSEFYKLLTMDYAKLLLISGHYKISEISDMLGFASADYFSRVFKKITGDVPSQYKK